MQQESHMLHTRQHMKVSVILCRLLPACLSARRRSAGQISSHFGRIHRRRTEATKLSRAVVAWLSVCASSGRVPTKLLTYSTRCCSMAVKFSRPAKGPHCPSAAGAEHSLDLYLNPTARSGSAPTDAIDSAEVNTTGQVHRSTYSSSTPTWCSLFSRADQGEPSRREETLR